MRGAREVVLLRLRRSETRTLCRARAGEELARQRGCAILLGVSPFYGSRECNWDGRIGIYSTVLPRFRITPCKVEVCLAARIEFGFGTTSTSHF